MSLSSDSRPAHDYAERIRTGQEDRGVAGHGGVHQRRLAHSQVASTSSHFPHGEPVMNITAGLHPCLAARAFLPASVAAPPDS